MLLSLRKEIFAWTIKVHKNGDFFIKPCLHNSSSMIYTVKIWQNDFSKEKETVNVKLIEKSHKCESLTVCTKKWNKCIISGPEWAKNKKSGGSVFTQKWPGLQYENTKGWMLYISRKLILRALIWRHSPYFTTCLGAVNCWKHFKNLILPPEKFPTNTVNFVFWFLFTKSLSVPNFSLVSWKLKQAHQKTFS